MSDNQLPDDLREVESALRRLAPQPIQIAPARMLFLAGQESVRAVSRMEGRVSARWREATLLSSALALTLAVVIVVRPQAEPTIVYRDRPVPRVKESAQPETPLRPAAAEEPRGEPPERARAPLVVDWQLAKSRRQQLRMFQNPEVLSLASAGGGSIQPVAQRELLRQLLRESGVEHVCVP